MSRKIIVLSLVLLALLVNVHGQNKVLVLKNKITGKERIIPEGKRIKVVFNNGDVIKGKVIINDATRLKGNNEILINNTLNSIYKEKVNINSIVYIKVPSLARNIIGGIITGIGVYPIFVGVTLMSSVGAQDPDWGGLVTFIGFVTAFGGALTSGIGIITWTGGKQYNRDDWEYIIRTK